ncbi:hypothetical protein TNCV_2341401 [Trichonephila clavipes]|nr:hypothetical protein TNCV_2341401 [Trichonephila clavipes]
MTLWGSHKLRIGLTDSKMSHALVDSDQAGHRPLKKEAVVEKVDNMIMKDHCLTVGKTTEQVEVSADSTHKILCDCAQSGYEICSQASVGGTERILLFNCTVSTSHHKCGTCLLATCCCS